MTIPLALRSVLEQLNPERLRQHLMGLPKRYSALALIAFGLFSGLSAAPFHFFPALVVGLTALVWLLDGSLQSERPGRSAFWRK